VTLFNELKRRNVLRVAAAYIVTAWLIIQVVETILPQYGLEHYVRTVITVLAIGFVPAVILAWALEWTPEGIRLDAGAAAEHDSAAVVRASRRFDRIVIVILTVALAWFVYDKLVPPAPEVQYSIAVLPFSNESPDTLPDYLADGLAGEVRDLLAKLPQLLVVESSPAFSFRGQGLAPLEIGERLGVSHLLTGAVTQLGDRIRVRAQLVDAADGESLWSKAYTGTLADIFAIQDEIASDVTGGLAVQTDEPLPKARRTTPEVLALTLQAKKLWYDGIMNAGAEAMTELLDEALEIDPSYTPAMVWQIYANWSARQQGLITRKEEDERWLKLAARILALEPENGNIHNMFAWQALFVDQNLQAAASSYARALRSEPNDAEILRHIARFAMLIGRKDDSISIIERSMAIDPLCSMCLYFASRLYMYAGQLDQAVALRQRFITLHGEGYYQFGLMKLLQGKATEAETIFRDIEMRTAEEGNQDNGETRVGLAMAFHTLGRAEDSDELLRTYIEDFGEKYPREVAKIYAWRGEKDLAFQWFQQADEAGSGGDKSFLMDPLYTNLHDDPRWEAILEKRGFSKAQLAALEFPVELLTQYRGE
jgi:TolB-like protein/Flp pilus assembly protein TadD